jgi:parallel beta-helix repeat protein
MNNTCNYNNEIGINTRRSNNNDVKSNRISFNKIGVNICSNSIRNIIFKNNISNNSEIGVFIYLSCNNNILYHNNFILNTQQVINNGSNFWYNNREGNHWSDYTGVDNGANGRVKGDGIGDTKIPHQGVDYYPFVNPNAITEDDGDGGDGGGGDNWLGFNFNTCRTLSILLIILMIVLFLILRKIFTRQKLNRK